MKGAVLFLLVAGGWRMLLPQAPPGRELHGRIVNMESEPAVGVPSARVKILSIEQETVTNRDGEFFLRLPDSLQAGEQVEVTVNAQTAGKQLLLFQPLDGRIRIPAGPDLKKPDLKKEVMQIGLLPKGSRRFLSDGAIQALLELANRDGQIQAMREQGKGSMGQFDLTYFLEQWGKERGIDPSEVAKRVAVWAAAIVGQPSADRERQALAAFAQSEFEKAGRLFAEAGDERLRRLKELRKREDEERRQVVDDYTQSGDADFNGALYQRALVAYQQALAETDRERDPTGWAELKEREGNAYGQLGEIQEGPEAIAALRLAIDDHRQVLPILTREGHARDWARTQNNLGNALEAQGERSAGEESVRLLAQAVEADRNALQVYTREQLPQDWARTQNNLGVALEAQGERSAGEEGVKLLAQAVEAYRNALQIHTREQLPQDWAATQNNLGNALRAQGERSAVEESMRLLAQAVEAYRNALQIYTREQLPQDWARTQNNLGIALRAQEERSAGEESTRLLAQAVEAYRNALQVYTREQLPQDWAATQNNLGNALQAQGVRSAGEESVRLLAQAVEAHRNALQVRTREQLPQNWAATQNNLGAALQAQGERSAGEESTRLLAQAVEADRFALQVYTRELLPQGWAITQNNLGLALEAQGERSAGEESVRLLAQAVEAYRSALQVRTREQLPQDWAQTQKNLGVVLVAQGDRSAPETARPIFMQAVEVFSSVLEVYPNSTETMGGLGSILHERLFDFQRALAINRQRAEQLPRDTGAAADFIESQFTMGQFAECITRSTRLRGSLGPDQSGTKTILYVLETSCHLGQGHVPEALALVAELSHQLAPGADSSFPSWTFSGTRHFVETSPALAAYREPLLRLLVAFESRNVASAKQAVEGMSQFLTAALAAK